MPKSLPGGIVTQLDAGKRRPVLLFELGLSSTVRFCASIQNIGFPESGGNLYTAKAIFVENFAQSLEGQIDRVSLRFDNVAKDMAAYANNEDFEGKSLIIKRIFLDDYDASDDYVEFFNGYMERPKSIDKQFLSLTATSGKPLTRKTNDRKYQKLCSHRFGGNLCNKDGNADLTSLTATGTADSGSTTTLVDNALTEANDHWNVGNIKITIDGVIYNRIATDFVAGTDTVSWAVALPTAVSSGDAYVLHKGCDKTWDTCLSNNAWGPNADNSANFGGFLHIGEEKIDSDYEEVLDPGTVVDLPIEIYDPPANPPTPPPGFPEPPIIPIDNPVNPVIPVGPGTPSGPPGSTEDTPWEAYDPADPGGGMGGGGPGVFSGGGEGGSEGGDVTDTPWELPDTGGGLFGGTSGGATGGGPPEPIPVTSGGVLSDIPSVLPPTPAPVPVTPAPVTPAPIVPPAPTSTGGGVLSGGTGGTPAPTPVPVTPAPIAPELPPTILPTFGGGNRGLFRR